MPSSLSAPPSQGIGAENRLASEFGDTVELMHDTQSRKRGVGHQAQAFSGEVIDQREDAEASSAHECVRHEVERPAQIATLRDRHRRPGAESPLASAALTNRQAFLLMQPIELLAIELDALALEHQTETAIAEPPPLWRQFPDLLANGMIVRPLGGGWCARRVLLHRPVRSNAGHCRSSISRTCKDDHPPATSHSDKWWASISTIASSRTGGSTPPPCSRSRVAAMPTIP